MIILPDKHLDPPGAAWSNDPADIPNQKGFKLVVQLKSGQRCLTQVVTNYFNLHSLKGVAVKDISSWRKASFSELKMEICP